MRIDFIGGHATIDDNSEEAKKIKEGYDCSFKNGKVTIGKKTKSLDNKYKISNAIKKATTLDELKTLIIELNNLK